MGWVTRSVRVGVDGQSLCVDPVEQRGKWAVKFDTHETIMGLRGREQVPAY